MKWKIILILLVLILVVGTGCEKASNSDNDKKEIEETNSEDKNSGFYDGLDDALAELDELEQT